MGIELKWKRVLSCRRGSEFQAADCVKLGGRVTGSHKSLWKLFQKCCAVECVLGGGPVPVSGPRLSVFV